MDTPPQHVLHTHKLDGQTLRHAHEDGHRVHGYFEHPEDPRPRPQPTSDRDLIRLDLADARWRQTDDTGDHLIYDGDLIISGVPMHLEAVACDVADPNAGTGATLDALGTATGAHGPFETATMNGREYVIVATPHCT